MDNTKKTVMGLMSEIIKSAKRLEALIAEDYRVTSGICPECKETAYNDIYMPLEGYCSSCYHRLADIKGERANKMN